VGLMLGGLIAANSSTILTHLNWGASYMVHDFYRRFLRPGREEKHYVLAGRVSTVILFVVSSGLVFFLETAQDTFNIMLQVGAGTGLLYLLRWFWWRITAWCEIAAMISSFSVSLVFLALRKNGVSIGTHQELFLTVLCTTVCWLIVAYAGPQTDPEALVRFYRKVHPAGPGWRKVREMAGITEKEAAEWSQVDNIPLSLLGWLSGSIVIWSGLFTVGNVLYGRWNFALLLALVFVISGTVLVRVTRRLWQ
jgi:SSS family solute:Na+ symporter